MKKHLKHPKLSKPNRGQFSRNELTILGTNCGLIKSMSDKIQRHLQDVKVMYMDARHGSEGEQFKTASLVDNKSHWQINNPISNMDYSLPLLLNDVNLLVVNGNHAKGDNQIIVIDSDKEASLKKRLGQITSPIIVLVKDNCIIPEFLKEVLNKNTPILSMDNESQWLKEIDKWYNSKRPEIYGLLLNGGKSTRMGTSKSNLSIDGKTMLDRGYELLSNVCTKTFISVADNNHGIQTVSNEYIIMDRLNDFGPYGGILSAFMTHANVAWLVMAVDLPFVKEKHLTELLEARNSNKVATAFRNEETKFPDPLLTIWEPSAYQHLLQFMSLGYSCPRKILINTDINLVEPSDKMSLFNMNTPDDFNKAKLG